MMHPKPSARGIAGQSRPTHQNHSVDGYFQRETPSIVRSRRPENKRMRMSAFGKGKVGMIQSH